jgi:hypothetical protein
MDFDLEGARNEGYSDEAIRSYLAKSGYSGEEIKGIFSPKEIPLEDVPGMALKNLPESAAGFGAAVVDPILHPVRTMEGVGRMMAGASDLAMGDQTPEAEGVKDIGKFFAERYGGWENLKQTMATDPVGFLADISTVLTAGGSGAARLPGMAGRVGTAIRTAGEVTNPISMAGNMVSLPRKLVGATKIPEGVYERSMKMPPGSVRDEVRGGILDTLVNKEKLPLNKNTMRVIRQINDELHKRLTNTLDKLSDQGSQFGASTIDVNNFVDALEELKKTYNKRGNAKAYHNAIDAVRDEYLNHAFNNNGAIMVKDAYDLRAGIYEDIQDFYMNQQKPASGRVGIRNKPQAVAKAEIAKVLRQSILDHPDVPAWFKTDLERHAGLMNARKWVERATNRGGNLDPLSLGGMMFGVLVEGGLPAATAFQISKSQPVMTRFSIFLKHGSETLKGIGSVAKPGALASRGVGLFPTEDEDEKEIDKLRRYKGTFDLAP